MFIFLTQKVSEIAQHISTTMQGMEHASESLAAHTAESTNTFDVGTTIAHHLNDAQLWKLYLFGIDMSITKRVVMMWIASFLLIVLFVSLARIISKNKFSKPGRFQGFWEVLINFVRNDVAYQSMGKTSKYYEPFLLTLFFFILFGNLLGLIPSLGEIAQVIGGLMGLVSNAPHGHETPLLVKLWPGITFTGDINVTGTLAVISFLVIQLAGFVHQGPLYIRNIVPKGIPLPLWPIMWPVELLGQFTKPFALAIRLLANMTGGHIIILVFLGFIFQFHTYFIAPVSVLAAMAIYLLEIFVAFLQAYIFVFLTALFVAGAQHRH